ncbi:MAG: glutathione S-transferase [Kofleriaceae bacterium]|nr:glutathione S-transferase [Kofleriaceae bacterium]
MTTQIADKTIPETSAVNLTLYYTPRSRSFAALWLLEELGEDYQLESFDITTARHKKADYLALNPMGKVPLVVDGDTPIPELGAIAIYLSDRYPGAKLSPLTEDPQRPAYLRWTFFSSAIMEPAFCEKLFKWEIPAHSVAWGSFDQMLDIVTKAVTDSTWLLGDSFSSADILVGSNLRVGQMLGIVPKEGPINDYISRLEKRDGFVRAEAIEARESDRFPAP